MTTDTSTDVNPPADPEETTEGGTGTDGHVEGNGAPVDPPIQPTGHVEGNKKPATRL